MKIQTFSENEWLYPDTVITKPNNAVKLESARGANISFQILTDKEITKDEKVSIKWEAPSNIDLKFTVYQLLPARVEENSAPKVYTTLDYDSVSHFVTRRAPFYVYDVTRNIDDGCLKPGRAAFYVRVFVPENCQLGEYELAEYCI